MPLTVVLAIGLESSLPPMQNAVWKSAGYIVTSVWSIHEAIDRFKVGDFDLVILGHSLPPESRERLVFLIRATGSQVPVVFTTDSCSNSDSVADATIKSEPDELLAKIGELLAAAPKNHCKTTINFANVQ
jgi:DNA-binding response OmpR family regulator